MATNESTGMNENCSWDTHLEEVGEEEEEDRNEDEGCDVEEW